MPSSRRATKKSGTLILDHACAWLANQEIHQVRGPIFPNKGENLRGLLIWGFDSPPVLMNAYNPPAYATYFEKAGFTKDIDYYAYHYDLKRIDARKTERVVRYAQNKYGFRVNSFDRNNIGAELARLNPSWNTPCLKTGATFPRPTWRIYGPTPSNSKTCSFRS